MSNTTLTADIIAKEAVMILENELTMGKLCYRGYEPEFDKNVNGYKVGETVSVRRPTDFTVRDGKTAAVQDVVEGKIPITVDKQKGIDFKFSSQDLTLQIGALSDRVIKPAMIQLANQIDVDMMALYNEVPKHFVETTIGWMTEDKLIQKAVKYEDVVDPSLAASYPGYPGWEKLNK